MLGAENQSRQPVACAHSRRQTLAGAFLATVAGAPWWKPPPADALPLAPLGGVERVGGSKLTGLTVEQVKDILARDLSAGQYFVTGNLTREVFADDCQFKDPTNDVTGLSRYTKALGLLFDPEYSVVRLRSISVAGPRTIEADYVSGGYLKFPWHPRVEPYEGHIIYTLNEEGLVQVQEQTWSKPAFEALRESFTPTSGPRGDIKHLE
ncbi:hypothetical protein N2152v2_005383 [Parachlorella kessleri]